MDGPPHKYYSITNNSLFLLRVLVIQAAFLPDICKCDISPLLILE
jgi:hypothetical protein